MAEENPAVAENMPAAAPVPAQVPQVDEEKVRLAEELRQARAALGEVGEMVKTGKLKLSEPTPPVEQVEDDSALIDRKELKKFAQSLNQTVGQAFQATNAHHARQMRDAQIELLRGKLKDFDKLEVTVRELLDKVDPVVASNPETIKQVHRIARADYLEKKETEEAAARAAAIPEGSEDPWGEPLEEDTEEVLRPNAGRAPQGAKPVARQSGGVAPSGDASASRPTLRTRTERAQPLSNEERAVAERFGFTSAAEYRQYADKNWHPDTQGSKGRGRF
jgi:hypothetical protein